MSDKVDVEQEYANFCPCIYKGKIKCIECDRYKYCDMKEGRIHRGEAFKAGWDTAIKFMTAEFAESFSEKKSNTVETYDICLCGLGKKGCINPI